MKCPASSSRPPRGGSEGLGKPARCPPRCHWYLEVEEQLDRTNGFLSLSTCSSSSPGSSFLVAQPALGERSLRSLS